MASELLSATILLILVIDPFGNVPLVAAALAPLPAERRVRIVLRECVIAYGVLLAFLFGGHAFLTLMRVSETSLSIAGGVILFLIALRMIFAHPEGVFGDVPGAEPFIVPLAIPAIAGPSALATVMLMASREPHLLGAWVAALTCAMVVTTVTLVAAERLQRLLGERAMRAFERLMDEFQLTQETVAERTGKDRTTVANSIRLLKLEPTIQDWIEEGKLSAGHGRALLAVPDLQLRMRYAQRAARGGLTVRQIERLASRRSRGAATATEVHADANIRAALEDLQRQLGTKVLLRQKTKLRPGQLVLEYYDDAQLMGIYDRLMK